MSPYWSKRHWILTAEPLLASACDGDSFTRRGHRGPDFAECRFADLTRDVDIALSLDSNTPDLAVVALDPHFAVVEPGHRGVPASVGLPFSIFEDEQNFGVSPFPDECEDGPVDHTSFRSL